MESIHLYRKVEINERLEQLIVYDKVSFTEKNPLFLQKIFHDSTPSTRLYI